ncbi:hypothetical protein LTR56_026728 [Elasticomyces elasticus]|nr:hypothetical protein LTR56_026728 [Elasticomyces elasticus]
MMSRILMGFGHYDESDGLVKVDDPLLQGGLVAVYYLPGTLVGALWGGWLGDRYGRIRTTGIAALWAIIRAALQCSSRNASWMFCARVFNGIGTGILNAITPAWATETASHTSRGALGLFIVVWFMPESPRWLVKVGRDEEARFILGRLRGEDDGIADAEFHDIKNIVKLEQDNSKSTSYFAMFFGIKQGKLHIVRRVQLVIWLQILQEWIGIAGITIYGPEIFTIAGIAAKDRQWVSGLNNITYMLATLICVFTLDRIGRRWTLYWGAVGQGICCFAAGGLSYATQNAIRSHKTHIFPLQVRAKGNAWGVVGWSIGNGWCVLLLPMIFAALGEKTLYIFGGVNVLAIIVVWALYPETNQRTLEEMNLVFASDSMWSGKRRRI